MCAPASNLRLREIPKTNRPTGVTGQIISPAELYARVYYDIDQFIPRDIKNTPSGHNIPRDINWPMRKYIQGRAYRLAQAIKYNLAWSALTPGIIWAGSNLSRLN